MLELIHSSLPVVTIDHIFDGRISVVSDNMVGTDVLVRYAYRKGHRRIAFIHGEMTAVTRNRLAGFYRTCDELGINVPDQYVREGVYHDPERCAEETKALLALPVRPTCILLTDDFSGIGGLNAIAEAGLRVPEDISVAGYDGIRLASMTNPKLTTYRQDTTVLGKTAAARLVELIEHPKTTLLDRIIIPGQFIEGKSIGEIPLE